MSAGFATDSLNLTDYALREFPACCDLVSEDSTRTPDWQGLLQLATATDLSEASSKPNLKFRQCFAWLNDTIFSFRKKPKSDARDGFYRITFYLIPESVLEDQSCIEPWDDFQQHLEEERAGHGLKLITPDMIICVRCQSESDREQLIGILDRNLRNHLDPELYTIKANGSRILMERIHKTMQLNWQQHQEVLANLKLLGIPTIADYIKSCKDRRMYGLLDIASETGHEQTLNFQPFYCVLWKDTLYLFDESREGIPAALMPLHYSKIALDEKAIRSRSYQARLMLPLRCIVMQFQHAFSLAEWFHAIYSITQPTCQNRDIRAWVEAIQHGPPDLQFLDQPANAEWKSYLLACDKMHIVECTSVIGKQSLEFITEVFLKEGASKRVFPLPEPIMQLVKHGSNEALIQLKNYIDDNIQLLWWSWLRSNGVSLEFEDCQPISTTANKTSGLAIVIYTHRQDGGILKEKDVYWIHPERNVITIGRDRMNVLRIEDAKASRSHAKIVFDGKKFEIFDMGSRRGTLVNNIPVANAILHEGDRIAIGDCVLAIESRQKPSRVRNIMKIARVRK